MSSFETLGVQDVVSKSIGSSSPYNMVQHLMDYKIYSLKYCARRGLKVRVFLVKVK